MNKPQFTLGSLLSVLRALPGSAMVTDLHAPCSYRGIYSEIAFSDSDELRTCYGVLAMVEDAIGSSFWGWHGGEFRMNEDTTVWLAPDGEFGLPLLDITVQMNGVRVQISLD